MEYPSDMGRTFPQMASSGTPPEGNLFLCRYVLLVVGSLWKQGTGTVSVQGGLPVATQSPIQGAVRAMRLHSKGTGMKGRPRVLTGAIVGGLAVLLMAAVAGCADAEPNP